MKKGQKARFRAPLDGEALAFSTSLPVDKRLYREDIAGSIAHVRMLARQGIITSPDARAIAAGLKTILGEIEADRSVPSAPRASGRFVSEDIHMAIEARLTAMIGPAGGLLHTGRSRNDQVALDERLYLVRTGAEIIRAITGFQRSLVGLAGRYADVIMPGYTHLQRAQPILFPHHLLAYAEMAERDRGRFADGLRRASRSPLGAGALGGTSFPIDRRRVARELGLAGIEQNSIDAVSDRDSLVEFVAACAITMMHLSRCAEDLILWSSEEWRFVSIGEAFTTGSSIMPQKKNPDMAELVRGKTGRVYGDLIALLTVMKGLPLAYNRDMQEDKEPLFDAAETTLRSLRIMARMLPTVNVDRTRFEKEMAGSFLMATELADYLARKGLPFRQAHAVVGAVVAECSAQGILLSELPLASYRRHAKEFGADLYRDLDPQRSVRQKRSEGSTSPVEVRKALARWKRRLQRA
jgi:argininosuccinate lyase